MLKAVIFDMDGVLVHSEPIHKIVEKELYEGYGISMTEKEHHSYTGTTQEYFWRSLKEKYGLKQSVEELVKENQKKYLDYIGMEGKLAPLPGVVGLLEDLMENGYELAVATSARRSIMGPVLKRFDFEKFFNVRVCADDVVRGKPDPEIFLKAAEGLGVAASECVVFEDAYYGIQAAKAAGMKVVAYTNFGTNIQDVSEADLVIDDYGDVSVERLRGL